MLIEVCEKDFLETNFLEMNFRAFATDACTECVTDLDKFNLVKLGYGGLVLASSQFLLLAQFLQKKGQKWHKNNHLALLF